MDVNALRAMVQRMNPGRKESAHKDLWFKPTEDPTVIRILPNPHSQNGIPFFEVAFHYDIGGERSVVCPKVADGSPCPICDLADDFRARSGKGSDDPNFRIFKDLSAKARVYAPVLVRGKEKDGVKLWGFPLTILQFFLEKAASDDWGDFTHPVNGRDVTVQLLKPGTSANPSKYPRPTADLKPSITPIARDKEEIKRILASVPNFFELDPPLFDIKSHDELVKLVQRIGATNDGETEYAISDDLPSFSNDTGPAKTTKATDIDDDLDARLNSLLGD